MSEREQCQDPKCLAFDGQHAWWCPSAPAEWRAANFQRVVKSFNDQCRQLELRVSRLVKQVTFWQGKFRIVTHENNQLRKRLRTFEVRFKELEARVERLAEKKLELRL